MTQLKTLLQDYKDSGRSLIACNLQNSTQLSALHRVVNQKKLPAIVQFSDRYVRSFIERRCLAHYLERFRCDYIYFHLDHCDDMALIKRCVDYGFDSVMYDGSQSPVDENIAISREIIDYAHAHQCLVEGEIGQVGGVEDGFGTGLSNYADLDDVESYYRATGVDLLALGVGNLHGFYTDLSEVRMDIFESARARLGPTPLFVLHGATGMDDALIRRSMASGVAKINFSSVFKKATMESIQTYASEHALFDEFAFSRAIESRLEQLFGRLLDLYTA